MNAVRVPTYWVEIRMAGDIADAKRLLRQECYRRGLCVTVQAADFVDTGGEEAGIVVGLLNYPRFPSEPADILYRAREIALALMPHLNQKSALLVAADVTEWLTLEPPGAREPSP